MSRILCLDASTEACSVALLNHGETTELYQLAPRQHAQLLIPLVEQILADSQIVLSQLDTIACLVGPGAFTGIRIGVSVAQGLAFGTDLPTIPLSSLENLAQQAFNETNRTNCFSAIDARMGEVYFGGFHKDSENLAVALFDEQVILPDMINFNQLAEITGIEETSKIGSGWRAYEEIFKQNINLSELIDNRFPRASASLLLADRLYRNGRFVSPERLQPVYLRDNVAVKKQNKN